MKTENKPQPFISKAKRLNAELSELKHNHGVTVSYYETVIADLRAKHKKQSQRLGGYVQSNKNYKEKVKRQNSLLEDLIKKVNRFRLENSNQGNSITSLRKHYELACKEIDGLKFDVIQAESNYEIALTSRNSANNELKRIRSKWWFKIFNW